MSDTLNVKRRQETGTKVARRMRREGLVPAVLYGHGEGNVPLSVSGEEVDAVMRHRSHVVDLSGDEKGKAFVKDVQWDPFGMEVLHLDLERIKAGETVEVELGIRLRGTAPGVSDGGIVEQPEHSVLINCPAISIPESLELNINELKLNESLTAADLPLPEGASLLVEPETVIAQCVPPPMEPTEEEEAELPSAEPEIIGRKPEEEEGGGEGD